MSEFLPHLLLDIQISIVMTVQRSTLAENPHHLASSTRESLWFRIPTVQVHGLEADTSLLQHLHSC